MIYSYYQDIKEHRLGIEGLKRKHGDDYDTRDLEKSIKSIRRSMIIPVVFGLISLYGLVTFDENDESFDKTRKIPKSLITQ